MFSDKWITALAERIVGTLNPDLYPNGDTEESGDPLDHQESLEAWQREVGAMKQAILAALSVNPTQTQWGVRWIAGGESAYDWIGDEAKARAFLAESRLAYPWPEEIVLVRREQTEPEVVDVEERD